MAQLTVRRVSPEVVGALKRRAAANGRSAEAEHREILRAAPISLPVPMLQLTPRPLRGWRTTSTTRSMTASISRWPFRRNIRS